MVFIACRNVSANFNFRMQISMFESTNPAKFLKTENLELAVFAHLPKTQKPHIRILKLISHRNIVQNSLIQNAL